MIDITGMAQSVGFAECHVLTNERFIHYKRRRQDGVLESAGQNLCSDPQAEYPWSNALVLLLYAYHPYAPNLHVSGNYPSSNAAYHAVKMLIPMLTDVGVRAERVYVPVRELAMRGGVGAACKNGLTCYGALGTRIAAQVLAANVPEVVYAKHRYSTPYVEACKECTRCETACPSQAISDAGYDFTKCARAYMGRETMPVWAMEMLTSLLGCEICQFACPLNNEIPLDTELPEAFALDRILSGAVRPVLDIVGSNLNSGGRILCQAMVLAAHAGRKDLLPEIQRLAQDAREQVKAAAAYAISLLQA